jgi:hypothetical protein
MKYPKIFMLICIAACITSITLTVTYGKDYPGENIVRSIMVSAVSLQILFSFAAVYKKYKQSAELKKKDLESNKIPSILKRREYTDGTIEYYVDGKPIEEFFGNSTVAPEVKKPKTLDEMSLKELEQLRVKYEEEENYERCEAITKRIARLKNS